MVIISVTEISNLVQLKFKRLILFQKRKKMKLSFLCVHKLNQYYMLCLVMALINKYILQVNLVGGYYDAGDNIKFHFPMAFTTTMLAWSVIEFGDFMSPQSGHAIQAIKWSTDYLLQATSIKDVVYVQVGDPYADHNCWERPEDMDTPRTSVAVTKDYPGSEVSAEIAAALAASSIVFRRIYPAYSNLLLTRAEEVLIVITKHFIGDYVNMYNAN